MTRKVDGRFKYPDVIDPPRKGICIQVPLDENHARAFFAALNELALPFAWEWVGDASGNDVSAVWKEIVHDAALKYYSEDNCMASDCIDCYVSKQQFITEVTNNYTTFNTWHDEFNTSGGVSIATQVSDDIEKNKGHDAATEHLWCYMTELYINALCEGLLQQKASESRDRLDSFADVAEAVSGALGLAALLVPAAGATALASAALGIVLGSAIARVLPANINDQIKADLQDAQARTEVACCMYSRLKLSGTIITAASWIAQVLAATTGGSFCDDTNFSEAGKRLRAFLRPIVATTEQYIAFWRTLSDFDWLASEQAGLIPACACDEWCYLFDFTIDDGGWSQHFDTDLYGVYDAGVGWKMETKPGGERAAYIGIDTVNQGTVTRVDVYVTLDMTGCETIRTDQIWLGIDDFNWPAADTYRLVRTNLDCPCGENETFIYTAIPSSPVNANWFGAIITRFADSADGWITAVKYTGRGANPFGSDNC